MVGDHDVDLSISPWNRLGPRGPFVSARQGSAFNSEGHYENRGGGFWYSAVAAVLTVWVSTYLRAQQT